ncbi:MAG: glycosyltransferase family 4 protein [Gemmatimonadota bacterium]
MTSAISNLRPPTPPDSRPRVLYLSVHDPHVPLSGAGARVFQFIDFFSQRYQLDLVYLDGSGQPPIPALSQRYADRLPQVGRKVCVDFSRRDYFLFSWKLYRAAREMLESRHYDLIICDYGLSAVYGLLLTRRFGVPFIYCSHNVEHLSYLDKAKRDPRRLPLALYVYLVERMAVRRADLVVPITQADADFFQRWGPRRAMVVVPQGFDKQVFNTDYTRARNEPRVVLFCGNFQIPANREVVETVVRHILEPVVRARPNTVFRFVGAHPPLELAGPHVEFTGFSETYPLPLQMADVVISPIRQGRGFPTKILEALACGKPTISTPVGARAIEPDYAALEVCEIADFPGRIIAALDRDEPVIIEDFPLLRERYAWKTNLARLAEAIDDIIDRARPHANFPTASDLGVPA